MGARSGMEELRDVILVTHPNAKRNKTQFLKETTKLWDKRNNMSTPGIFSISTILWWSYGGRNCSNIFLFIVI